MKEHIHTIPVMDALRDSKGQGCPFCVMRQGLEDDAVAFMLGSAYMEDDVRMETNRQGFCAAHLDKMYAEQNRLGLALMLQTFMQQLNKDIDIIMKGKLNLPLFKKPVDSAHLKLLAHLHKTEESCYLCARVGNTFARYLDTFFYLWTREKDVPKLAAEACFCLPHFAKMVEAGEQALDRTRYTEFLSVVVSRQMAVMRTMEADLDWFVQKFDYRNVDEPWKNAKDALPRALAMMKGQSV